MVNERGGHVNGYHNWLAAPDRQKEAGRIKDAYERSNLLGRKRRKRSHNLLLSSSNNKYTLLVCAVYKLNSYIKRVYI